MYKLLYNFNANSNKCQIIFTNTAILSEIFDNTTLNILQQIGYQNNIFSLFFNLQ